MKLLNVVSALVVQEDPSDTDLKRTILYLVGMVGDIKTLRGVVREINEIAAYEDEPVS